MEEENLMCPECGYSTFKKTMDDYCDCLFVCKRCSVAFFIKEICLANSLLKVDDIV